VLGPFAEFNEALLKAEAAAFMVGAAFVGLAIKDALTLEGALADLNKVLGENDGTAKDYLPTIKEVALQFGKSAAEVAVLAAQWKEAGYTAAEVFGENGCKPHAEYTKAVYEAALDVCGKTFNTKEGVRIGCLLIPMFSILFELQLEYSTLDRLTFITEKGDVKMHPILSEIRKQTSCIEKLWNNLGFKEPLPTINPKLGNGSYVDEIME
jgi:hypothetical protein